MESWMRKQRKHANVWRQTQLMYLISQFTVSHNKNNTTWPWNPRNKNQRHNVYTEPSKLVVRGRKAIRQIQLSLKSATATHIPQIYQERTTTVVLNQAQWSLLSRIFCITLNSMHHKNINNQTYPCIRGYARLSELVRRCIIFLVIQIQYVQIRCQYN